MQYLEKVYKTKLPQAFHLAYLQLLILCLNWTLELFSSKARWLQLQTVLG